MPSPGVLVEPLIVDVSVPGLVSPVSPVLPGIVVGVCVRLGGTWYPVRVAARNCACLEARNGWFH